MPTCGNAMGLLVDIVLDIVRLLVGAPTRWHTMRPVTPNFPVLLAHAVQTADCLSECAYMCGIGQIVLGASSHLRKAHPNLRSQWMRGCNIASTFLFLVAMVALMERCFRCLGVEPYSFAVLALVSCGAIGAWLGRRKARRQLAR